MLFFFILVPVVARSDSYIHCVADRGDAARMSRSEVGAPEPTKSTD